MLKLFTRIIFLAFLSILACGAVSYAEPDGSVNEVVITAKGKKYHLRDCRTVKKVSRTLTVSEAKKRGYKPCKVCNPPEEDYTEYPDTSDMQFYGAD